MIATVIQGKTYAEILSLLDDPWVELAEIRLDLCPLSDAEIEDLFSNTDTPLIATCRANWGTSASAAGEAAGMGSADEAAGSVAWEAAGMGSADEAAGVRNQNRPKMQHPPVKIEGGASKSPENAAALPPLTAAALPQLNFNAVAQGYSCDTVARYLNKLGIRDMLVDIGEILCRGVNASGKPWRVGVDRPTDGNATPGADLDGLWESDGFPFFQGIVTSGNYRKFYVRDGVKYSHTIDPRTGRPAENGLLSATIVAPTAELADALATYCMVIGLDAAREYILSRPDIDGYLIYSAASPATSPVAPAAADYSAPVASSAQAPAAATGSAPEVSAASAPAPEAPAATPPAMSEWASPGFNLK